MTEKSAFKGLLMSRKYRYHMEDGKIVITQNGRVDLSEVERISDSVIFANKGNVFLDSVKSIPTGVEFRNWGDVSLYSLGSVPGGYIDLWEGNLEKIQSKRLLNLMVKRGMFI